jgi:hypothetical protein
LAQAAERRHLEELGLCYLRVPTRAPSASSSYFNGHNALAVKLVRRGIAYQLVGNAFIDIADIPRAQALADQIRVEKLRATRPYPGLSWEWGRHESGAISLERMCPHTLS